MKNLLVLGAGLSSSSLIKYLLTHAAKEKWIVTVADANEAAAKAKVGKSKLGKTLALNIENKEALELAIKNSALVVSLLPPTLHPVVAKICIKHKVHLITASYVSDEMRALHPQAIKAGVLLLNEMGLDPGIDHLSAMQMIHEIQDKGGVIDSFGSYCGGLVAPEFDTNPWHYKFTWNPRNVVLAGQATARFKHEGLLKLIPPHRIFEEIQSIKIPGYGTYDAYANRDSLGYIEPYGIGSAKTVIRGTLRNKGFCQSWQALVKLGLTDDSYRLHSPGNLSYRALLCSMVPNANMHNLEKQLCLFLGINAGSKIFKNLQWLGLFEAKAIALEQASPAMALQKLLQEKWKLEKGELDQIVMKHEIEYTLNGKKKKANGTLVVTGDNEVYTAMAKTVGLPLGIAAKLLLQGKIHATGVQIPITRQIYEPVLVELDKAGIRFIHS